jgi:hypothetical protein
VLPRLVVNVRKAVRRLTARAAEQEEVSGAENQARWRAMLSEIEYRDRAHERRLAEAERALNRLSLN